MPGADFFIRVQPRKRKDNLGAGKKRLLKKGWWGSYADILVPAWATTPATIKQESQQQTCAKTPCPGERAAVLGNSNMAVSDAKVNILSRMAEKPFRHNLNLTEAGISTTTGGKGDTA